MANVGVRKYLNNQGYNDDQITYDSGMVKLNGKNFFAATPQQYDDPSNGMFKDSTYGDDNALKAALNRYNASQAMDTYKANISKPVQMFQAPTAESLQSDPQYQAALRNIQAQTQTAQNNAMVSLGARGIGNSSSAVTAANQLQQQAQSKMQNDVVPQLIAQRYQQWLDQQKGEQMQNENLLRYAGLLDQQNQQELDNQYRSDAFADKQKQDRIALADTLSKQFGTFVQPTMDSGLTYDQVKGLTPLATQQFDYGKQMDAAKLEQAAKQFDQQMGYDWAKFGQNDEQFKKEMAFKNDQFDWQKSPDNPANQKNNQAEFDRGMEIYKSTGQLPDYMSQFGVNIQALNNERTKNDVIELYDQLLKQKLTPKDALKAIDDKVRLGLESAEDGEVLKQAIYTFDPSLNPNNPKSDSGWNAKTGILPESVSPTNAFKQDIVWIGKLLNAIKGK